MKITHSLTVAIIMTITQLIGLTQIYAQDIILTKKGKEYKVKIHEINEQVITFTKYRQSEFDDRFHMMNIHRLVAIKYEHNGITDADGTPISLAEFEYRKTVALRNYHMNSGIPQLCWGATLATFGFCMMGYSIYAIEETSKNSHWDMGGPITYLFGLIAFGPAIPMLLVGGYKTKRALHLQKQLHSSKPSLGFRPIVAPNVSEQSFHAGISLRVSF